jgi:hypothetical protein
MIGSMGCITTVATTAVGEAGRYQFLTTLHFDATSPQQTGQGSLNSEHLIGERMATLVFLQLRITPWKDRGRYHRQ